MSTPTRNATNAATMSARTAMVNQANANFIAAADAVIADQSSRGQYLVCVELFENVNLQYIALYYQNLGYVVSAPLPPNVGQQPAALFGEFWDAFWSNGTFFYTIYGLNKPHQIYISWLNPITGSYAYPPEWGDF